MKIFGLLIAAGFMVVTGCGPLSERESGEPYSNDHSIQELCDFPKGFFLAHYGIKEISAEPDASKSLNSKIDASAECHYDDPTDSSPNFGYALISPETEYSTVTPAGARDREIETDGTTVTEIELPLGETQDPDIAKHIYMLRATIDGWQGELSFKGGDEETRLKGAAVLVSMVRNLKGAPVPPNS